VVRVRREDEEYYLTYKGQGLMCREEYNLPLTAEAYTHLLPKADGTVIRKKRYLIPLTKADINEECLALLPDDCKELTVELDEFAEPFAPLLLAEVEFPSKESAEAFHPLPWFTEDVTTNPKYHNSNMSSISKNQ
jgi:CYTH domain-containing protein